jgi:hypothetical protein
LGALNATTGLKPPCERTGDAQVLLDYFGELFEVVDEASRLEPSRFIVRSTKNR